PARDISGDRARLRRARQRRPQKISETPALHRPHAVRELFHDRDFPDPVALPRMDVGTVDCDYSVRRSNLAAAAFWLDAGSQSVKFISYASIGNIQLKKLQLPNRE